MDSKNRVAGVAFLKADGQQFALRGNMTVSMGSVERETVTGQDGVHGYTEKPMAPFIEADITDSGGVSIEAIERITRATVTAELANGKVYVLREAWVMKAPELNTTDGTMSVRFEGFRCEEIR